MLTSQLRHQIDLNFKSYEQIQEKIKHEAWGIALEGAMKTIIVKEFFVRLIQGGAAPSQTRTPTRHLTIETINRYIFVLNVVQDSERGHISEVELRKRIKMELERDKGFEMDKKTLRRIVENLKQASLVKTKQFKVTIYQDRVSSVNYRAPINSANMAEYENSVVPIKLEESSPGLRPMTRTRRKAARTQKYFEESSSNLYDSEVESNRPQKQNT